MKFKDYVLSLKPNEREDYARRAGTTIKYLPLLTGGHRKAGPELARRLSEESGGVVPLSEIRPDIWAPEESAA